MGYIRLLTTAVVPISLKAAVVVTSPEISISDTGALIYFDAQTGSAASSGTAPASSFVLNYSANDVTKPSVSSSANSVSTLTGPSSTTFAVNYSSGATIDSSATWTTGSTAYLNKPPGDSFVGYSTFPAGTEGYLGLRVVNGGGFNYGWADVSYNADQSLTLHRFAIETTVDQAIVTPVPEPTSTFAAALAAGSFAAYRARRRLLSRRGGQV